MDNTDFLIEGLTSDVVKYIVEDKSVPMQKAMDSFYYSKTNQLLNDKTTGLYIHGPEYIYNLYNNEIKNGSIVQQEI